MGEWYILTLVGKDQIGIVARITQTLFKSNCNLGEASMMRLGENFTIMLMVKFSGTADQLQEILAQDAAVLNLHMHIDESAGGLHHHLDPNIRISVYGADRMGIVAQTTNILSSAGLHILNLESDVGGSNNEPIYIMHIEGYIENGIGDLLDAQSAIKKEGIHIQMNPVETVIG